MLRSMCTWKRRLHLARVALCLQNVGAVARACNCFECEAMRVVDPECTITARSALNAAMGGQRLLWQAERINSVAEAVTDCAYSIAFARWTEGGSSCCCCWAASLSRAAWRRLSG